MNNLIRQGDIFSVKTSDNRFLFGRVLLDIATNCLDTGLAGQDSPPEKCDTRGDKRAPIKHSTLILQN